MAQILRFYGALRVRSAKINLNVTINSLRRHPFQPDRALCEAGGKQKAMRASITIMIEDRELRALSNQYGCKGETLADTARRWVAVLVGAALTEVICGYEAGLDDED